VQGRRLSIFQKGSFGQSKLFFNISRRRGKRLYRSKISNPLRKVKERKIRWRKGGHLRDKGGAVMFEDQKKKWR